MAQAPPKMMFASVDEAKACLAEVLAAILPLVKEGGSLYELLNSPDIPPPGEDDAPRKQFLMGKAMPIVTPVLGAIYQKYGFAPPPMGVMAGSMAFNNVQDADVQAGACQHPTGSTGKGLCAPAFPDRHSRLGCLRRAARCAGVSMVSGAAMKGIIPSEAAVNEMISKFK